MTIPVEQVSPYALRLVPARDVAARYGVSLRSIDRWLAKKVLPVPDRVINGRRYWLVENLERADRQHVLNTAGNGLTAAE
jgi:DNA-binding transcriptional MerR regulator